MKPHEESWTEGDDRVDGGGKPGCVYGPDDELILSPGPGVQNRLRATLASAAPDMARALLAFINGMDGSQCAEDCENARLLAEAALTKGGVPLT